MSFLSITFLFALPLAIAPLLLHFFDRRRNSEIEWGAMQFLLEASTRQTSARRLKQWLLMLLRVLAIAALIFALARPLIPKGFLGGGHRGETIFVVDNSMSMQRESGDGSLMDDAIHTVKERLKSLPSDHDVRILSTAPYPVWSSASSVKTDRGAREHLMKQLDDLQPTQGRSDLLAALFSAVGAEISPSVSYRDIVILTDGQSTDWRLEENAGWARFHQSLNQTPVPTKVETVPLATKTDENVSVVEISMRRHVLGVGQKARFAAKIRNHGAQSIFATELNWSVDDSTQIQSIDELEAGQDFDAAWEYTFETPGTFKVNANLVTDDVLAADNQSSLVVDVVEEIPVVIVEDAFDKAEIQQDGFFCSSRFGWIDGEPLGGKSVFHATGDILCGVGKF